MMNLWEQNIPGQESVEEKFTPYMTPYLLQNETPHGAVLVLPGAGTSGARIMRVIRLPCG